MPSFFANFQYAKLQIIKRCNTAGVESVYDLMEMEDDKRNDLLQMDTRQM